MPQRVLQVWSAPGLRRMAVGGTACVVAGLVLTVGTLTIGAQTAPPPVAARPLASLNTVPVPVPPDLGNYLKDTTPGSEPMLAAQRLGKALFWDMQVGSDGVQACASCHFEAGADSRLKNQVSPGLNAGDTTFQIGGGPNYTLQSTDFPFHTPGGRDSNDVASSQGVFRRNFGSINPPSDGGTPSKPATVSETCPGVPDEDGFAVNVPNVGVLNVRRVEPRNAPTVINAVFNFRNFWDGRAQNDFNGANPFGFRDPDAGIYVRSGNQVDFKRIAIRNGSLASQAVGPPGSRFEMSCNGRAFPEIGRKLLAKGVFPLAKQHVDSNDSLLGPIAMPDKGLSNSYSTLIQAAFRPEYWTSGLGVLKSGQDLKKQASVTMDLTPRPNSQTPATDTFSQMEANFSLFFGLSVQLYESTLVANQTPFDRFMEGNPNALSLDQKAGLGLFSAQFGSGKGKCDACHGGAELTNASVANVSNERLERMIMGNDGIAVYDNGFYNTAVRPTNDDVGVGGKDPIPGVGKPLSETAFCQAYVNDGKECPIKNQDANGQLKNTLIASTIAPRPGEPVPVSPLMAKQCAPGANTSDFNISTGRYNCDRINVMGAFKTPGLRNVELTGPYMHNGGMSTLRQVVDFYNRGGDFPAVNQDNLDPNIVQLGLTPDEANQLVAFMLALTDERVRFERAPFDHPELFVPNGHPTPLTPDASNPGQATDDVLVRIPAVGANGGSAIRSFTDRLGVSQDQQ